MINVLALKKKIVDNVNTTVNIVGLESVYENINLPSPTTCL